MSPHPLSPVQQGSGTENLSPLSCLREAKGAVAHTKLCPPAYGVVCGWYNGYLDTPTLTLSYTNCDYEPQLFLLVCRCGVWKVCVYI